MNKLRQKYKKLPLQLRAGIWFTFLQYFQQAIVILATPIFTRIMTTDQYGIINVYNTLQGLLNVILTLKLSSGIYQLQLFEYKDNREGLTSSLVILSSVFLLLSSVMFFTFRGFLIYLMKLPLSMIMIMMVDIWAQMVLSFWLTRNRFEYKYRICFIVVASNCIIKTFCSVAFVLWANDNQAFYKVLGNTIPETIVALIIFFVILHKGRQYICLAFWREAIRFNIVLVPSYLSAILLSSSDRLMINHYCSSTDVALYSIAYSCAHLVQLFFAAINWVFTPYAYECLDLKNYIPLKKTSDSLTVIMAALTALLISFAPEAIAIFAPASYSSAIYVIPPAACGIFLTFIYGFFTNAEYFYKKNVYITVATIIGAAVNILLNWLLIPRLGYLVASYTTIVGYLIMTIIHYYFYKKIVDKKIYNVKLWALIVSFLYLYGFVCLSLYDYVVIRYCIVLSMLIIAIIKRDLIISVLKDMKSSKNAERKEG